LIFAGLYYFTEDILYSKTWSIMHLISFICLIIHVWTWGFVERVYFGNIQSNFSNNNTAATDIDRFTRIQQFYVGVFMMMIIMQFVYFLNLIVGFLHQKSSQEN